MASSTIPAIIKTVTITKTTSAAGSITLSSSDVPDLNCIIGILNNSASNNNYVVQYRAKALGLFGFAAPHNPLTNTEVTLTLLYV